jgi:hypothetical protein
MSIPINHHYVSQCQQKEFFNHLTGLIYIYDKELDNHYSKQSSKRLFSEDHANTRENNGIVDQTTLESELKILIEDEYPKHVRQVEKFVISQEEKEKTYESLCWLTILGILGEIRHPHYKKEIDDIVFKMESDIIRRYYNFTEDQILMAQKKKQQTPYFNLLSYMDIALKRLEKLEPLDFFIVSIESNDHFLLPDTSCFQLRGQLRHYLNPYIQEIIQVGVPLTDKLYILATPQSLDSGMHGIKYERDDNSELVYEINKDLNSFSRKAIACSSETYLKSFVNKVKE